MILGSISVLSAGNRNIFSAVAQYESQHRWYAALGDFYNFARFTRSRDLKSRIPPKSKNTGVSFQLGLSWKKFDPK